MNPIIINLIIILIMLFGTATFIITLWLRHRIFIDKAIIQDGVLKSRGGRYRIAKNRKLYSMFDFFHKHPLEIDNPEDFLISSEGMPFFGVRQVMNVTIHIDQVDEAEIMAALALVEEIKKYNPKKAKKELKKIKRTVINVIPWIIPEDFNTTGDLNEYTYSWALDRRIEAYEETKHLSKQEMLLKFYIPMGLIVLAALLIIFYPKILAAVRDPALTLINNRLTSWTEILTRFR